MGVEEANLLAPVTFYLEISQEAKRSKLFQNLFDYAKKIINHLSPLMQC